MDRQKKQIRKQKKREMDREASTIVTQYIKYRGAKNQSVAPLSDRLTTSYYSSSYVWPVDRMGLLGGKLDDI